MSPNECVSVWWDVSVILYKYMRNAKKKERVLINDLRDIYVILSYCEIEGSYTVKYREVEFEEDKLSIYVSY